MTDIKKINIYMGVVGQAYVDKETAKKQMDTAAKNVVDVKYIIYLIDHSYETEFIALNDNNYSLTTQSYEEIATATLDNANEASQLAATVKQNIENALQSYEEGSQQYIELQALLDKLAANDTDGNYENGGNTASAQANIASINAFIVEIDDIKTTAQGLLTENQAYYDECVEAFNNAKDEFESYVPEASENQSDKNDELETALIERLNNVATGLETAQATTDAINQTSNEAQAAADEITQGGGEEPEPTYTWYQGMGTEEEIQSQEYINGLSYNQVTKPANDSTLTLSRGYNVFIFPSSWSTPTFGGTLDYSKQFDPYTADELNIVNPSGKTVFVIEAGSNGIAYIKFD